MEQKLFQNGLYLSWCEDFIEVLKVDTDTMIQNASFEKLILSIPQNIMTNIFVQLFICLPFVDNNI